MSLRISGLLSSRRLVPALVCVAVLGATALEAQVVINEIDYDQPSTDTAEFVELRNNGAAAVDLAAYTLELVNGTGGGASIYNSIDLPPTSLAPGDYFVVCANAATVPNCDLDASPDTNFIQNGSPDAVGLRLSGTLVDAVSYEGDSGAPYTEGSGSGLADSFADADMGISRCPDGADTDRNNVDFALRPITPGAANSCPGPQLVINEIDYDQPGTDSAEFVEIHNVGAAAVSLGGISLELVNGTGGGASIYNIVALPSVSLAAGDYFVVCANAATVANCDLDASPDTNFIQNGAPDAVALREEASGAILDTVSYEGDTGAPYTEDSGSGLEDDPGVPGAGISRCPDGFDSGQNNADFVLADISPGAANACPAPPGVTAALSEIRIDQPGSDDDEYFELAAAPGTALAGLTYLVIGDGAGGSGVIEHVSDLAGSTVPASGFFVAAEATFTLGAADLVTGLNFENSDNVTHLLVRDFTGSNGDDLDTDDDGVLDSTPWSALVDCVALIETVGSGDLTYCSASAGPDGSFVPAHVFLCPEGWQIGPFDPSGGADTPGAPNSCGRLVINEIDYDQPGTDTAEFVEIKNVGGAPVDLDPFELQLVNGTGGGATIYNVIDLPATSLAAGDYFVVCANAATVVNCDLDASPDTNFIQNGAPDAVALAVAGTIIDTVSYEGDTGAPYTEGSGVGLQDFGTSGEDNKGISRLPDGVDTDVNNADLAFVCITPGFANTSIATGCGSLGPVLEIFEIQSAGAASPFDGALVTTRQNVVTTLGTNGFFMQTPPARADGNVDTSDGIFVFTGGPPPVVVGDLVDVTGVVDEFFGLTEFAGGSSIVVTGNDVGQLPAPVAFDGLVPSPDPSAPSCAIEYECYEGMLVEVANGFVAGANQEFGSDPFAEVHISAAGSRPFREPGIEFPGLAGLPLWDGNPEVFEMDPDKLGLPNLNIPAGSTFAARGVLGFEFNHYELWPSELTVVAAPLPVAVRPRQSGEMTVGSLNLFRLFDDVDDPPSVNTVGATRDDGVVSAAEYQRRRAKLAAYIVGVLDSPDVLAVQEAEKLEVLQDLAAEINLLDPAVNYTPYLVEGNDVGTIDVGFLVRDRIQVDAVTQLGATELFTFDVPPSALHDRPPLLLEGTCDGTFPIAVLTLHMRSLGGIETTRVQQKRFEQAESVAQMVQSLQSADPEVNLVVVGDFNAFEFTDGYADVSGIIKGDFVPGDSLVCATNVCTDLVDPDLVDQVLGVDPGERYSFIFRDTFNPVRSRGDSQVLDHAMTSRALTPLVRGFQYGRGNADAAEELLERDGTEPGGDPIDLLLRTSDHDGLVLYLFKDEDGDGVQDDLDLCLGTRIPEAVPTLSLGVNRFALTDGDGQFDTRRPRGAGPGASFTIEDTAGCSCEQIIAAQGLGAGHVKYGCSLGEMREWVGLVDPSAAGSGGAAFGAGGG